jgi:hypothetical protein
MAPAGGASTKASIPRKRTRRALLSVSGITRRLRRLVRHAVRWRRGDDDRRRRRVGVNHVVGDTTILTASGKGPVPPRMPRSRKTGSASRPIIH